MMTERGWTMGLRTHAVTLSAGFAITLAALAEAAIIVDHNCTNLDRVPDGWIDLAKAELFLSYGHTSHGSQIVTGVNLVNAGTNGTSYTMPSCNNYACQSCYYDACDDFYYYRYGTGNDPAPSGTLSFWDRRMAGANDLGSPDRYAWATATRTMLDNPSYVTRNVVMWSWCGQADTTEEQMQIYLDLMNGLHADYPTVIFVYMTGHLNGTGVEGRLNQRNNQIRSHALATDGVLFDFADIESYDPDGNGYLHLNATDTCNYSGGNWAVEWCNANPGSELCLSCSDCAHSHCLNCNLKGRAFWWMMARLAGWAGQPDGDANCDSIVDLSDFAVFTDCFAGPGEQSQPLTADLKTCLTTFDFDDDGDVDLSDFKSFANTIAD